MAYVKRPGKKYKKKAFKLTAAQKSKLYKKPKSSHEYKKLVKKYKAEWSYARRREYVKAHKSVSRWTRKVKKPGAKMGRPKGLTYATGLKKYTGYRTAHTADPGPLKIWKKGNSRYQDGPKGYYSTHLKVKKLTGEMSVSQAFDAMLPAGAPGPRWKASTIKKRGGKIGPPDYYERRKNRSNHSKKNTYP
jgi:hypothetical protein